MRDTLFGSGVCGCANLIKMKIPNRSAKLWIENFSFSSLLMEGDARAAGGPKPPPRADGVDDTGNTK